MTENEKTLKALSLIAAELYMQNLMTISMNKGMKVDYSYVSEIKLPELANHFFAYFEGGNFSLSSVFKIKVEVGR